MTEQERREHLLLVVDNVIEVHAQWAESDTPHITEDFETAVDEVVEVFGLGSIPADCRELTDRICTLGKHWEAWKTKAEMAGAMNPIPGNGFWSALESVEGARRAAEPKRPVVLESIKELTDQKVSDRQICVIYGWVEPNGAPQLNKVHEERAKPGTHINADFVAPQEKERRQKEARAQAIADRIRQSRREKVDRLSTPAPEPLKDLVLQGVSAEQIARLKHLTVQQVYAACDAQGIDRPAESYEGLEAHRSAHEGELSEEATRSLEAGQKAVAEGQSSQSGGPGESQPDGPGWSSGDQSSPSTSAPGLDDVNDDPEIGGDEAPAGLTLEQEIIFYYRQDISPKGIAAAVSTEAEKVTPQKVGKIIARYKREPEAFAMEGVGVE